MKLLSFRDIRCILTRLINKFNDGLINGAFNKRNHIANGYRMAIDDMKKELDDLEKERYYGKRK